MEGLSLPSGTSDLDVMAQSTFSMNTAVDSGEQVTEALWNDICLRMKKYFLESLRKLDLPSQALAVARIGKKRLSCVQSLCALFSVKRVWTMYVGVRGQQMKNLIQMILYPDQSQQQGHSSSKKKAAALFTLASGNLGKMAEVLIQMIDEDFILLNSGVFGEGVEVMRGLRDLYSDRVVDELCIIMERLQADMHSGSRSHSKTRERKSPSTGKRELPKSPSEARILGIRGSGRKTGHSKSADNLLSQADDQQFSDLQVLNFL